MRMIWWKKALVVSLIWVAILGTGVVLMLLRIDKLATSPAHAEAWMNQVGYLAGNLFGGGLVVIWFLAWSRRRRQAP